MPILTQELVKIVQLFVATAHLIQFAPVAIII